MSWHGQSALELAGCHGMDNLHWSMLKYREKQLNSMCLRPTYSGDVWHVHPTQQRQPGHTRKTAHPLSVWPLGQVLASSNELLGFHHAHTHIER